MNEFTIKLSAQDLQVIQTALGEAPFRIAAPLVNKINQQLMAQPIKDGEPAKTSSKSKKSEPAK